jgi:hypothetical protein
VNGFIATSLKHIPKNVTVFWRPWPELISFYRLPQEDIIREEPYFIDFTGLASLAATFETLRPEAATLEESEPQNE